MRCEWPSELVDDGGQVQAPTPRSNSRSDCWAHAPCRRRVLVHLLQWSRGPRGRPTDASLLVNSRAPWKILLVPDDLDAKRAQFEATALPFLKALYNAALRLTGGSGADAGDLVQETYLRAYRTFENFVAGTNCKAWLFTILYSVFVNQRKKEGRAAFPLPTDELEQRYNEDAAAAGDLVVDAAPPMPDERWGPEVERALRVLPEVLRAVVLLVDVEQLSYEEAAAALGWPIGTVRSRLFRARKQLFAALLAYAREVGHLKNSAGPT